MDLLATITALSHECGTGDYVKGGGGNTSAKNADTLWVKPSGTTLGKLSPQLFVPLDRSRLAGLYSMQLPPEPAAREETVKNLLAAAVRPEGNGRASVEAPLHDVLREMFVVHTHPYLVNGLTCARAGAATCARLFPQAMWVPYIDPGFTLCMDVQQRVKDFQRDQGRPPTVIILENHGIFVSGDTAEEIRAHYRHAFDTLRGEYCQRGIATRLTLGADPSAAEIERMRRVLPEILGAEGAGVAWSGLYAVPRGPISPDHIVYAKSYPYTDPVSAAGVEAYRQKWGASPRIFVTATGVFAVGKTPTQASLALEMSQDGALVEQLAAAFGGIQYLTDRAREFIENWEVEVYRQTVLP